MISRFARAAGLLVVVGCSAVPVDDAFVPPIDATAWEQLVAAEDTRLHTSEQRSIVLSAAGSPDARLRAIAVRALGRTERAEFFDDITPLLGDSSANVAAAAAHALAAVARDSATADRARAALVAALEQANDTVAAAIAESLGRLPADTADARAVAGRIVTLIDNDATRAGAVRGLHFLTRQRAGGAAVRATAAAALRDIALLAPDPTVRVLAIATLAGAAAADVPTLTGALQDRDPQVRREAVMALRSPRGANVQELLHSALADRHDAVRYAAVVAWTPHIDSPQDADCDVIAGAARDRDVHVARAALQLLAGACADARHAALLDSIAASTPDDTDGWQRGARATVALAAVDADRARPQIQALARHASPFARAHAASAARIVRDTDLLYMLAADPNVNVRTAAVAGLAATVGHVADSVFIAQLDMTESELLMTAAAALQGSTHPRAVEALLDAFDRVSALRRETSRDARLALLETIATLGDRRYAEQVDAYLTDFDAEVAARAASIVEAWTAIPRQSRPQPLSSLDPPTFDEATRIARSTFVLEMANGGEIRIRLLPFDAPTNAARFARLARDGYYDGLTIHRVEPNFVIQGGSPGANEYSGDGPYTRDEVGVPNLRGTVGLSTRGRDTGDAQFYINLIDNVRLDHQYTIFGRVVDGMEVVDALVEGAVIRRVREESR